MFKITVKRGTKEITIEIPLDSRGGIGMDEDGTGHRAIRIIKEMVQELNNIKGL